MKSLTFKFGMSWTNYGEWHIDHIVHVSLFKNETPFHIPNSLENLRPLNKNINISRSNKIDEDCINLILKYKTYIKDEYIYLIK